MLGDATLQTQDKGATYRLKFEQGESHSTYLNHLYQEFERWSLSNPAKKVKMQTTA